MSKKPSTHPIKNSPVPGYTFISEAGGVEEYQLKSNSLRVLYVQRPDTGVLTTNITYLVGAKDEELGKTGLAHMLEHMLFKPTTFDIERGDKAGGAMKFEHEVGCTLNANTWKDRTTYYFSYPTKFFTRALQIEAERMRGVILTDKALKPEQGNVLSEHDMYNGDPSYALAVQMYCSAFHSHPYGHETIGHREDIEDYTANRLETFYRNYYRPDNAVMMVIGDIDIKEALVEVKKAFKNIKQPDLVIPRHSVREPKQEGLRHIEVERSSTTNIVSIGFKHAGFPTKGWFETQVMLEVLASGPESILHKLLIDSGQASSMNISLEPTAETNLALLNITLAPGQSHEKILHSTLEVINALEVQTISSLVKKVKAQTITAELYARQQSLSIAQELTEYVASGNWQAYAQTEQILNKITTKKILDCVKQSFVKSNLITGYFIGTE